MLCSQDQQQGVGEDVGGAEGVDDARQLFLLYGGRNHSGCGVVWQITLAPCSKFWGISLSLGTDQGGVYSTAAVLGHMYQSGIDYLGSKERRCPANFVVMQCHLCSAINIPALRQYFFSAELPVMLYITLREAVIHQGLHWVPLSHEAPVAQSQQKGGVNMVAMLLFCRRHNTCTLFLKQPFSRVQAF